MHNLTLLFTLSFLCHTELRFAYVLFSCKVPYQVKPKITNYRHGLATDVISFEWKVDIGYQRFLFRPSSHVLCCTIAEGRVESEANTNIQNNFLPRILSL